MSVSVVVPAWNDAEGVQAIFDALTEVTCVTEVVVVDDCSDTPIIQSVTVDALSEAGTKVQMLRHDVNKGGGGARNSGLAAVTQPYVIFLDSDDLPTSEYNAVLSAFLAEGESFDFAMFRHLDTRELAQGRQAGLPVDERCWEELPKANYPQAMTAQQMALMSCVSAYPWNKLYRTDFLRANDIRCTEIPVHNDIELHWASFLRAERILYTHQTAVTHHVIDTGDRITNRKGEERLRVFEALEHICALLENGEVPLRMQHSYWQFFNKLARWIPNNLELYLVPEFKATRMKFLLAHLPKDTFTRIALKDPGLSTALLDMIREEKA